MSIVVAQVNRLSNFHRLSNFTMEVAMDQVILEIYNEAIEHGASNLRDVLATVTNDAMTLSHLFAVLIRKGVITQQEFDEGWEGELTFGKPTPYAARELERMRRKGPAVA